jgi:anti-anti-sigma factor
MRKDLHIGTRREGDATVIEVRGPVENATIDAFEVGLAAAVKSASRAVVDLSGMDMITSQGLGLLIKHTEAIGGPDRFLLAGIQPRVKDVFQALGLDQFFVIVESVDRALRLLEDLPAPSAP